MSIIYILGLLPHCVSVIKASNGDSLSTLRPEVTCESSFWHVPLTSRQAAAIINVSNLICKFHTVVLVFAALLAGPNPPPPT